VLSRENTLIGGFAGDDGESDSVCMYVRTSRCMYVVLCMYVCVVYVRVMYVCVFVRAYMCMYMCVCGVWCMSVRMYVVLYV